MASKLNGVNATIIIFVFVLYCMMTTITMMIIVMTDSSDVFFCRKL